METLVGGRDTLTRTEVVKEVPEKRNKGICEREAIELR